MSFMIPRHPLCLHPNDVLLVIVLRPNSLITRDIVVWVGSPLIFVSFWCLNFALILALLAAGITCISVSSGEIVTITFGLWFWLPMFWSSPSGAAGVPDTFAGLVLVALPAILFLSCFVTVLVAVVDV